MQPHKTAGKEKMDELFTVYAEGLPVKPKIARQRHRCNKHPVPYQLYGRNGYQVTQYPGKAPHNNRDVQDKQIAIECAAFHEKHNYLILFRFFVQQIDSKQARSEERRVGNECDRTSKFQGT